MDIENLKLLIFGASIKPDFSQSTLFAVLFWPDAFLFHSVLFSLLLVIAMVLSARKIRALEIRSTMVSAAAVFCSRALCFLALVASTSAALRIFSFVFSDGAENYGNQAAVTIFSVLFLIPAFFCVALVAICGGAMYFLLRLKLKR